MVGEGLWGTGASLVASATVLTTLLQQLGASARTIGCIGAIEALGGALPQIIGAYLFRSRVQRKRHLVGWHVLGIVPFVLAMGLLLRYGQGLSPAATCLLLLACWGGYSVSIAVAAGAWTDWVAEVFETRIRGKVIGLCLAAGSAAGMGGAVLAGWLIHRNPTPQGYVPHYLIAAGIMAFSMFSFMLINDSGTHAHGPLQAMDLPAIWQRARTSLLSRNFRAYLIGRALIILGSSIGPFIAVHYLSAQGGGLSSQFVVYCGTVSLLSSAVAMTLGGALGDRRGHRLGLLLGCMMQLVVLLLLLVTTGKAGCVLVFLASGLAGGLTAVAQFNLLLETCPHQERVIHINTGNLALVLPATTAPILGGILVQWQGSMRLFQLCLLISALAWAWFAWCFREPRKCR